MAESDGLLQAHYEVHCRGCEYANLGLGTVRARAEAQLRKQGWVRKGGRWYCSPQCRKKNLC